MNKIVILDINALQKVLPVIQQTQNFDEQIQDWD